MGKRLSGEIIARKMATFFRAFIGGKQKSCFPSIFPVSNFSFKSNVQKTEFSGKTALSKLFSIFFLAIKQLLERKLIWMDWGIFLLDLCLDWARSSQDHRTMHPSGGTRSMIWYSRLKVLDQDLFLEDINRPIFCSRIADIEQSIWQAEDYKEIYVFHLPSTKKVSNPINAGQVSLHPLSST